MSEETSTPKDNSQNLWFSDINLKTTVLVTAISIVFGIGGGAGLVATGGVRAQGGVTQDQADIRYLTKDEARQWRESRSKEIEEMKRELKIEIDKNLKKDNFDIYLQMWTDRQKQTDDKLERILNK